MASLGVLALGADALSPQVRFALGFVSASIVLACIPVATKYMPESGAWTTVLFLTFTLGMGNGMTEGSLYGLAAAATSRKGSTRAVVQYAVPAQAGQGFAGVLVCLMRIVTKASFSEDYQGSSQAAQVFFSLASLLSLACSFVGYYIAKTIRASSRSTPLVLGWEQKKDVVHEIRLFARANVTINCVTMMVFPSLATSSKATTTPGLAVSWMAVLVVTIFSVADTVGNLQGMSVIGWLLRGRAPSVGFLIRAAEARILFVPLFLLTSVGLVQSDAVVVLGASLLGFTNGSLSVACMTLAPETVRSGACAGESASKKEYGGYIMTVALLVGVTLGLTVAIPLNLVADVLRSPALH
jgi:equilibrative nucleoside transporter 1/2/3